MKLAESMLKKMIAEEIGENSKTLNAKIKKSINKVLHGFGITYHHQIPMQDIFDALNVYKIIALQEDGTKWSGWLMGEDGRATIDIGPKASVREEDGEIFYSPYNNTMLILTWHKMQSGKYEVVAYLS